MKSFRQRGEFLAVCFFLGLACYSLGQDAAPEESLADRARKVRKDTTNEVKMRDADTKKLFESVDRIFAFAAEDTGMPKHAVVKRQLVSKADAEKYVKGRLAKEEYTQRFAQEELSMKKLGFLPRDFNLKEFLVKSTGQEVAGYYDEETKTISMLNWVPPDRQEPILAHELTHALQDQNYNLSKWMKAAPKAAGDEAKGGAVDDSAIARKAVVEGQAMVVYMDYLLKPLGRSLEDTPGLIYQMEEPMVKGAIDSQLMHDAPMIMREIGTFSYQGGLIFEGELLHKGGKNMAFAGAFARPPRSSHEVLQPETYIRGEKLAAVRIPDMREVLNNQYEVYDSGGIGEIDVRALMRQYGEKQRIADDVSSAWQGGAYVTFRRKDKVVSEARASTADLALLYISRWKTSQAAERFAQFYTEAVSDRYGSAKAEELPACAETKCPVSMAKITTEEGMVIVEHRADNSVLVTESFDPATAAKLGAAVRDEVDAAHADNLPLQEEIGLRLLEIPAFRAFASQIGENMNEAVRRGLTRVVTSGR